jgi:hypothetical protein
MSATTHSEARSAARRTSPLAFTIASGLVERDVCLLELGLRVAVGGERDIGFELRGGLGCHAGRDGRAILHAVDKPGGEAGDEHAPTGAVPSEPPRLVTVVLQTAHLGAFAGRGRETATAPTGMVTIAAPAPGLDAGRGDDQDPAAARRLAANGRHVCTA